MRRFVGLGLALSLVSCASAPEKKEPTYTREYVEDLEKRVAVLQQKLDENQTQIAVLNERLENKGPVKAPETAVVTPAPAASFRAKTILQDDVTDRYREGLILWNAKRYPDVISEMGSFAKDNSQSPLTPRALHLTASAHAELGEYRLALAQWDKLFMAYPNSSVVPEALNQYAAAADAAGDTGVADDARQKLRNKFPHSGIDPRSYKAVSANLVPENKIAPVEKPKLQTPNTPNLPQTPKIPAMNDFDEGEPE